MEWLNEHSGLLVLISAIILVVLVALAIFLMIDLRNRIAVQKLKFLGLSSVDFDTRERYAEITVGNKSLNEVGLAEFGISNGIVNYDLTPLYKEKNGLPTDTRVVVEQRSAITFRLTAEELKKTLLDGEKKQLKKLRVYAIDLTGNRYRGTLAAVKKLLATVLAEEKKGIVRTVIEPAPVVETPVYTPAIPTYQEPETQHTIKNDAPAPLTEELEEEIASPEEEITE
ncbi:MAG: hypothetical protein K2N74_00935 [Clostridiales bacterium]|nr:hypothetical protein [Clostridiales bacterium]